MQSECLDFHRSLWLKVKHYIDRNWNAKFLPQEVQILARLDLSWSSSYCSLKYNLQSGVILIFYGDNHLQQTRIWLLLLEINLTRS